jgi:hypothetical protein
LIQQQSRRRYARIEHWTGIARLCELSITKPSRLEDRTWTRQHHNHPIYPANHQQQPKSKPPPAQAKATLAASHSPRPADAHAAPSYSADLVLAHVSLDLGRSTSPLRHLPGPRKPAIRLPRPLSRPGSTFRSSTPPKPSERSLGSLASSQLSSFHSRRPLQLAQLSSARSPSARRRPARPIYNNGLSHCFIRTCK